MDEKGVSAIGDGLSDLIEIVCSTDITLLEVNLKSGEPLTPVMRVPTGAKDLDRILAGGVESTAITLFFGEGGSGKTNVCLQIAKNILRMNRKVFYIDTEGVSAERIEQIFSPELELLKNLLFFRPHTFQEQERTVDKVYKLCEKMDIGGVILDSATVFYRLDQGSTKQTERASLTRQILKLLRIARTRDIPIVITTQVYYDQERGSVEPIGGHMLLHNAKAIVKFERDRDIPSRRVVTLVKHRSLPEGQTGIITIHAHGVD